MLDKRIEGMHLDLINNDEVVESLNIYTKKLLVWLKENIRLKYRWLTSFGGYIQLIELNQMAIDKESELRKNPNLTEKMIENQIMDMLKDNLF